MNKALNSKWFGPASMLALAALTLIAYSGTFNAPFQFDDQLNILKSRELHNLSNLWAILTGPRGITRATFALNYWAGGTTVTGYHIVNTIIHLINTVLVYLLLLSTLRLANYVEGRARWIAFFTSALFALHPLQTQAVTYIVQRMESLSGLFYLLCLLLFVYAAKAASPALRALLYILTAISYWCAFYSKESALTIPAIILLYDLFFLSGFKITGIIRKWPLYALLSLLFIFFSIRTVAPLAGIELFGASKHTPVTIVVPGASNAQQATGKIAAAPPREPVKIVRSSNNITAGFAMTSITPRQYLYTQFNVITYYFTLLLYPANQNLDYDFPVSSGLFEVPTPRPGAVLNIPLPPPILSLAFLSAIILFALYLTLRSIKKREQATQTAGLTAFFIFWFFIILSPTSSFVPIRDVIYEHRLYLPSIGFFLVMVLVVDTLTIKKLSGKKSHKKKRKTG